MVSEDSKSRFRDRSFLLIVRTRCVVTADRGSTGCSEIPANSRISLRQRFHLRTVHLLRLIAEGRDWLPTLRVAVQFGLSHR
jgi:hypothetical protein